jgi:hypothetical protein
MFGFKSKDNTVPTYSDNQFVPEYKYVDPILVRLGIVRTTWQNRIANIIISTAVILTAAGFAFIIITRRYKIEVIKPNVIKEIKNSLPFKK